MKNYEDVGLTEKLRAADSLPEKDPGWQDSLAFDSLVERASIKAAQLSTGAAGTAAIADLSVTTAKLANSAVTSEKIASGAVTATDIGGSIITGTHISNGGVVAANIGGSVIAGTHIALNAITNEKINDYDLGKGTGNINVTAGTINPTAYQTNGTTGATGNIVYVKTVDFAGSAVTLGTVNFAKGINHLFN